MNSRHSIHVEDTAGTNLSKSVGYLKLSHLSSLIAPAMGQEESLRLVHELLNDLDMIMSQVNESSSCIPHVLESTLLVCFNIQLLL